MISALDFLAVVFAAGAVIEVWHKGSLFDPARAYSGYENYSVDSQFLFYKSSSLSPQNLKEIKKVLV